MSLKPDHIVKFTRPMSYMRRVLMAIEQGNHRQEVIIEVTGLQFGNVRSAIDNLLYIKAILRSEDRQGRKIYYVPGQQVGPVSDCWHNAPSAFHPMLITKK